MFLIEREKKIPIMGDAEVAVVGGGVAGAAAALASARLGVKTILIEKEIALGGLATLGNVIVYLPLCDGNGMQVISGIAEEFMKLAVSDGFHSIHSEWAKNCTIEERKNKRYRVDFNPANLMLELERVLLEAGVEIWYDSKFCDISRDDKGKINALIIENKSGRIALSCKTAVDCSGDADVLVRAGEETESLKTNVECGWFFHFEAEPQNYLETESDPGNQELPRSSEGRILRVRVNSFSKPYSKDPAILPDGIKGYAGDDFKDISEHVIASREAIRTKLDQLKRKFPDKKIYPGILPLVPSFRMTRRLIGRTELKVVDQFRYFDDAVGMTGDWRKNGPVYFIPFGTLCGVKNTNLACAGRIISSFGEAWNITRVIPVCALTGEISGTAAALAVKKGSYDIAGFPVENLRKQLLKQGVLIDKSLANHKSAHP